jgi:hypothetical protein
MRAVRSGNTEALPRWRRSDAMRLAGVVAAIGGDLSGSVVGRNHS